MTPKKEPKALWCKRGHAKGLPYPDCCDHEVDQKPSDDDLLASFPEFFPEYAKPDKE